VKDSAKKNGWPLSLVSSAHKMNPGFDVSLHLLNRSFQGWVRGVGPNGQWHDFRALTTEEFLQVNLATVRESSSHRYWPQEVVTKFLAAEVITRNSEFDPQ